MQRSFVWTFLCALMALSVLPASSDAASPTTKDLYYFVVDRSGSIAEKRLVEPFRKSILDFVGRLDPETEVNLVFFSDSATRTKSWYPMDPRAKGEFAKYFDDSFRPGGQTLLFATVADVLSRVLPKESEYRTIRIVILSDGEDNKSAPKFTNWDDVERLLPEKWARQRKGFSVIWAAVEFDPPANQRPSPDSLVQMLPLNRSEIDAAFSPPPRASFTANPTRVKVNDPVLFALDDDTGVTTVQWTFGDGSASSKKTESHRYAAKGIYDVSVEVSGAGAKKSRVEKKACVEVVEEVPLEARFSWHPALVRVNEEVKFSDESLGNPVEWSWTIEGVGDQKERNPAIVFVKPGKARVGLTVSKEGVVHSVEQAIEVLPVPPDASFTAEPRELEQGQSVQLKASRHEPGWTHAWTIGSDVSIEGSTAAWKADRLGLVEIQHTVRGPGGIVDKTSTVFVKQPPDALVAKFRWNPSVVHVGDEVQLVDESEGAPNKWQWEITDRPATAERNPVVTFSKPGNVTVKLSIQRDGRKAESVPIDVQVLPLAPLVARFKCPKEIRVGTPVTLADNSEGAPKKWLWEIDGMQPKTERNPEVTFAKPGKARIKLTIERDDQKAVSPPVEIEVTTGLEARFEVKGKKGRIPLTVTFSDTSVGDVANWQWDFDDGTTSDLQNPSHEYAKAGIYRPRLTVMDSRGQSSKSPGDITINATGPLAWYWKALIALAVAVIVWLLVVVPVAKVFILPHASSRLFTTGPNRLREKALANSSIWWPVGYVRIGGSANDNIKLMITDQALKNKSLAIVQRVPFTKQYTLRAVQSVGVQLQTGTGPTAARKDIKTCQLRNGTVFHVANTQFRFELS